MNTKELTNKISYEEFENLERHNFLDKAIQNQFYSNLDFIEYFKSKDDWFWTDVIRYSNIDMAFLFRKFREYMTNIGVYYQIQIIEKHFMVEDPNDHKAFKVLERILKYNELYNYFNYPYNV